MPFVHWDLAGDDCRSAAIVLFEYFKQVVACDGIEGFEPPIKAQMARLAQDHEMLTERDTQRANGAFKGRRLHRYW
jgi:hypothetical protein